MSRFQRSQILVSTAGAVRILKTFRELIQLQTTHTENGYKFTDRGIRSLLEKAGFEIGRAWKDSRKSYTVTLACL
jgi:uncharacterized SAM-dependent methyltransferase